MGTTHPTADLLRGLTWRDLQAAAERFGIESLRHGQRQIIEAVLSGRHVLGIMPTGGGKSLCYQLPAVFLPNLTVVVSPLISLMHDQHEKLVEADVGVARLDSTLRKSEQRAILQDIAGGEHEVVYVTPERMESPEFITLLRDRGVSLFVIDEAHCISQWGHDFRPSYLALRDAIRDLGQPPVLALTATATPDVAQDILKQLAIDDAITINTGVSRENLDFDVLHPATALEKRRMLVDVVKDARGSTIVYCATVRLTTEIWKFLRANGINATRYHGQLKPRERETAQTKFLDGRYDVCVATKAFGLGIDKPDIRLVVHYHFPDSLETYYQEAGRAGRDGKPAKCTLLYRRADRRIQAYFLRGKYPTREMSQRVYEVVTQLAAGLTPPPSAPHVTADGPILAPPNFCAVNPGASKTSIRITLKQIIAAAPELPKRRVKVVLALLESAGIVERTGRGIRKTRSFSCNEELDAFLSVYEQRHLSDAERLAMMMAYAESSECRMRLMRRYFGEPAQIDCGHCDNCKARREAELAAPAPVVETLADPTLVQPGPTPAEAPKAFAPGQRVRHRAFGVGEVREVRGARVVVHFPSRRKRARMAVRAEFLRAA